MKYEAPELTALTAINAIQSTVNLKGPFGKIEAPHHNHNEVDLAYQDWE